jgi:hypothetical protein
MTAKAHYDRKRAESKGGFRTGFCNPSWSLDTADGKASHDRCTFVRCECECHGNGSGPHAYSEPTVVPDMPDTEYHAHKGSLSASGAKLLAPPSPCPAKFRWRQENPEFKDEFDFGHVAHRLVLGKGASVEVIDAPNWQTKAAKAARAAARAADRVPILTKDYERAESIAHRVATDDQSAGIFTNGDAEVSLFWPDKETGVVRRARFDWLQHPVDGRRRVIADLKTAHSSEPDAFGRSAADFGYAISAANYVDGAIACGLADDPLFVFVAVEKEEPYVVSTFYATEDVIELGRALMRSALRTYAQCVETGKWPGYLDGPAPLQLPVWYTRNLEDVLL